MKRNNNQSTLDKSLLTNIIRNSCWTAPLIGLVLYLAKSHLPERFAEGFLVGAACGTANLFFLRIVLTEATSPHGTKVVKAVWSGAGLFATVNGYLYIFSKHWFDDRAMVIGFSYFIAVTVVTALIGKDKKGSTE